MLRLQSQNIRLQEQTKIYLLRTKLLINILLSQIDSRYIKVRSILRYTQSIQLLVLQTINRKEKN